MEQLIEKKRCSGCTVCFNVCPKNAISMEEDKDGFKYPVIDEKKCINCGLCMRKCPVLNKQKNESLNLCFVGFNKNKESCMEKASSGSIFELIANYVLDQNGVVIGAAFDENNKLIHMAIDNKKDLIKLKGSKYLQSDLNDIFKYIKEIINERKVLFVGTPCQVSGIKSYIKSDNLICIDVVCHGVPTPKLFKKYIEELENQNDDKVNEYNFRDKTTGWDTYSNNIKFKNKEIKMLHNENPYMQLFLSDIALRKSCYNCNFKLGNKYSDITLGDFWGVKNYYPEMYNKNGVSAIIINTEVGRNIFSIIKEDIVYKECKLEEIIAGNPSIKISGKEPKNRDVFFNEIETKSINELAVKYKKKYSFIQKIKNKLKKLKRN